MSDEDGSNDLKYVKVKVKKSNVVFCFLKTTNTRQSENVQGFFRMTSTSKCCLCIEYNESFW